MSNAAVEKVLEIERQKAAAGEVLGIEDVRHLVAGSENRKVLHEGQMDAGAWSCGMVAGLIHDVPSCKELIDNIMAEAHTLIRERLEGMLA
jgi:NAD(P)H-dependent flavin oxidoreductase YrpB (nitropropane dioxygenase family)